MVTIENKRTTIKKTETEDARYSDLLASIINRPLEKALTVKEMRRDLKLLDLFETATLQMELEDDEFAFVKELVLNHVWYIRHKDIVSFTDYIESLV